MPSLYRGAVSTRAARRLPRMSISISVPDSAAQETPELINTDPYGEGWMVKVKLTDPSEADALLDAESYKQLLEPPKS